MFFGGLVWYILTEAPGKRLIVIHSCILHKVDSTVLRELEGMLCFFVKDWWPTNIIGYLD